MQVNYPYDSPIILTDAIFSVYSDGLLTGSAQKQIAYWLAEEAVSRDLNTFLLPTVVTGTYVYRPYIMLDHAYVREIKQVWFLDANNEVYFTATGSFTNCTRLLYSTYGVLDMGCCISTYCSSCGYPYHVKVAYEAGLTSGTSYQPNVLLALTLTASLFLNDLQGYGDAGVGSYPIIKYSNQEYSETRMGMIFTVYGGSPTSQFIYKLLSGLRVRRYVGI